MGTLRIYIKQQDQLNIQGQQIHYAGANPQSLAMTIGGLPQSRQWNNYSNYTDATAYSSDIQELELTWTEDRDSSGGSTPGAFQSKKSISGNMTFEGEAYRMIRKWLIDDVSAPLNAVDVKIHDTGCGVWYEGYDFKATDLRWCEADVCTFDVTLKQKDEALNCIKKTLITDNHQGWFYQTPWAGKKHPRFSYCNEQRPNGMMVMLWWIAATTMAPMMIIMIPILIVLNIIFGVLNVIIGIIKFIVSILGGDDVDKQTWKTIPYFDLQAILDSMAQYYVESAGCGREHPAPLIRDYIKNVCDKCNVTVDDVTAPIFFATHMKIETSGRGLIDTQNHHYNACYFNAPVQRGIRRYRSLNIFGSKPNNTEYYIPDNSPLLFLDQFLDKLKVLYNAEWRIKTVNNKPHLYFWRKDWFLNGGYIYDFTTGSEDRNKILEGVCFEWNEVKYPAYTEGLYSDDPVDTCGNEAKRHMNAYVSHGNVDEKPNFEGSLDKCAQFGATRFRLDGVSEDYIFDAMQVVVSGAILTPYIAAWFFELVAPHIKEYADYALLLRDETCSLPKVLIWDGQSFENARAVKPFSGYPIDPANGPAMPNMNPKYNGTPWHDKHPPETFVRGSGLTLPPNQPGYYLVTSLTGLWEIKRPALLCNYFMYFEPGYEDSMWDWFHWIDDPLRNPTMQQSWRVKMELCCDDIKKLGVGDDAGGIALGAKVKLPAQFYQDGKIKEITLNYKPSNPEGPFIELKGTL